MQHGSPETNACGRLENALSTLDPHSRGLMERFLAGQSTADIAAALQAPEETVAEKIRELVDRLRTRIGR